jgi:hypothetical protein
VSAFIHNHVELKKTPQGIAMHKDPRKNILIQKNALRKDDLKIILDHANREEKMELSVLDLEETNKQGRNIYIVEKETRDTQLVDPIPIKDKLDSINRFNIRKYVNPFYQFEIRDCELPQILSYGIGGHYIPHVDAEGVWINADGSEVWRKSIDRDISVVYFLNDDFEGGELVFPELDLTVKPEAGTMICFPATHQYLHGVNPVISGHRYTMVTWMRVKGFPTLDDVDRMYALMNSRTAR